MNKESWPQSELAGFYNEWSGKSVEAIDFDIRSAERKADAIVRLVPQQQLDSLHRLIDFGCGYGAVIRRLRKLRGDRIVSALGLDFSETAIDVACARSDSDAIRYKKLPALDVRDNSAFLHAQVDGVVDAILLIDLLEHVPDCHVLIAELAPLTRLFLIKLPVESSLFDNYFLPKEYPSTQHSNGHLREFDANNVHYFIRSLGLTPVFETLYRYDNEDSFPPMPPGTHFKRRFARLLIKSVKIILGWLLPTRIFLRIVGGGGYLCLASYNEQHVLNP
jgi:SAM-dependent methyltransferase